MRFNQIGVNRANVMLVSVILVVGLWLLVDREQLKKAATLKAAEVIGNIAVSSMPDDVAGGFHNIPIEVRSLAPGVYQASGISNTHLIVTTEGNVLFDSGISIQAAQQLSLLKEKSDALVKYIILSHSHADHIGGVRFWREDTTDIVVHREFAEEQRYLLELEPYFWNRSRTLFPWMPEKPTTNTLLAYARIQSTIEVDERDYRFTLGDREFVVLSTPGAEGADNMSLWLPAEKILFTGDTLGPLFPQFPNIFTMRGEKVRKPREYIDSLNKLLTLNAELLVPSHHNAIKGAETIRAGLVRIRDATRYVHDQTVKGMNEGKSLNELMTEIRLPARLQLTQAHGKVSWAVRSIWEYYASWFHFESTTDLYPRPVSDVYVELAEMAGNDALLFKAREFLDQLEPVKTLHLLEIVLAAEPANPAALGLRLKTLKTLLDQALAGEDNNYEKDYLRRRIAVTEDALQDIAG